MCWLVLAGRKFFSSSTQDVGCAVSGCVASLVLMSSFCHHGTT